MRALWSYLQIVFLYNQILTFLMALCLPGLAAGEVAAPYVFSESELTGQLSQVTARQVFQDSKGFIWVLTQEGLNRYDGKTNKIFMRVRQVE